MPSVIQLPTAPNTGYDALANVLLQSATQFGAQRRADANTTRQREERLADIASERGYADTNYARSRTDRLADIASERGYADTNYARNRTDHLEDIDDARRWEYNIKNEGGKDAQARLNQIANEAATVIARMEALEKSLSEPEPMPPPEMLRNASLAIARLNSSDKSVREGRTPPSNAEISAALPQAEQEARTILNAAWQRQRLDAREQQRINATRLTRLGSEKNTITNLFRRVGIPSESAPAEATPPARAQPTLAELQDAFRKSVLPPPPSASINAAPRAQQLPNPENDSIIAAEQARRDEAINASRLAPLQGIESELADVESQIAKVRSAGPSMLPTLGVGITGGMNVSRFSDTGGQAQNLSSLYQRKQDLTQRRQSLLADPMLNAAPTFGGAAPQSPGGALPIRRPLLQLPD